MARDLIAGDAALRSIKPGDPRHRISDGDGLYLRLFVKGGSHGWRLDYSINGVRKTLSLGTYPDTGLGLARKKAAEARKLVSDGIDPSEVRKADKARAERERQVAKLEEQGLPPEGSFEHVARRWLSAVHESKVSAGHAERTRIRLEQDVFPWVGRRPIGEIEARDVLECLDRVVARGAIETAHRIKDACGQIFRYGIPLGLCVRNPAADLRDSLPAVPSRHHAAIVEPQRAAELLKAMVDYKGSLTTRIGLALSVLLFLRPGELRQLEWAWVDADAAMVTIPSSMMKRKKKDKGDGPPHLVPLAPQALALLDEIKPLSGAGRYIFPSVLSAERPMSENTLRTALRRLGYTNEDMTPHGFRAMARTMAAERLGIAPEVIEAQLAHAVPDALGRAYNRTTYLDQRRELMTKWAEYVDRLRRGADVLPLHASRAPG